MALTIDGLKSLLNLQDNGSFATRISDTHGYLTMNGDRVENTGRFKNISMKLGDAQKNMDVRRQVLSAFQIIGLSEERMQQVREALGIDANGNVASTPLRRRDVKVLLQEMMDTRLTKETVESASSQFKAHLTDAKNTLFNAGTLAGKRLLNDYKKVSRSFGGLVMGHESLPLDAQDFVISTFNKVQNAVDRILKGESALVDARKELKESLDLDRFGTEFFSQKALDALKNQAIKEFDAFSKASSVLQAADNGRTREIRLMRAQIPGSLAEPLEAFKADFRIDLEAETEDGRAGIELAVRQYFDAHAEERLDFLNASPERRSILMRGALLAIARPSEVIVTATVDDAKDTFGTLQFDETPETEDIMERFGGEEGYKARNEMLEAVYEQAEDLAIAVARGELGRNEAITRMESAKGDKEIVEKATASFKMWLDENEDVVSRADRARNRELTFITGKLPQNLEANRKEAILAHFAADPTDRMAFILATDEGRDDLLASI